jgi:hypothetical protein
MPLLKPWQLKKVLKTLKVMGGPPKAAPGRNTSLAHFRCILRTNLLAANR